MPVATENKESLDILSLANATGDSPMELTKSSLTSVHTLSVMDMEMEDEEKEQESEPIVDISALVKNAPMGTSTAASGHTAVIIFDWDDTLLASSFLSSKGHRLDSDLDLTEDVENGLRHLEQSVIAAMTLAFKYGEVHIVTNAETGWVQLSAQKWMPAVVPLLSKVTVISARSTYESRFPASPFQWKFQAMHSTIHSRLCKVDTAVKPMHVISLGDSHVEREAVRAVTQGLENVRCKSVKFAEHPTIEQLRRQLDLVTNCFQYVYSCTGNLDLMLSLTVPMAEETTA
jgi:hypothetical protein